MPGMTRRTFVKGAGAATGAAVVGGGSMALDRGPVQESEAIAPILVAAAPYAAGLAVTAGSVALGWALREYEILGSNPPPDGLTAGGLHQSAYETLRTRESTNKSTLIDNRNILQGVGNSAYTDAKIAAIEQLNQGKTQQEVEDAATTAINSYATPVQKNLLNTWNEATAEIDAIITKVDSHADLSRSAVLDPPDQYKWRIRYPDETMHDYIPQQATLADGTQFGVNVFGAISVDGWPDASQIRGIWSPLGYSNTSDINDTSVFYNGPDGSSGEYLDKDQWTGLWTDLQTEINDVKDGIILWVDNVYGQVQSGEIEVTDLLTPREQAAMMTDDGQYPQAVADLIALNIPVDLDRKATITYTPKTEEVTLSGSLGVTSEEPIASGNTYDPAADIAGDVYFTYDISKGTGTWTEFQTAVDGGNATFTKQPYEHVTYSVTTTAGETATAVASDFTDNGDGTHTVDLSSQLDNAITEVSAVSFTSTSDETQYETIQIQSPFTVDKIEDSDGKEVNSVEYSNSEPQTDSNYITQEEWDTLEKQNQELIDKYEESQDTSTGGAGAGFFGDGGPGIGVIAAAGAALALVFGLGGSN